MLDDAAEAAYAAIRSAARTDIESVAANSGLDDEIAQA